MNQPADDTGINNAGSSDIPELPYPDVPDIWKALNAKPEIDPTAWIASNATVLGRVKLGRRSSVFYGAILRGDGESITVGDETNIQDLSVLHTDRGYPCEIGNRVTIGHRAIVHACHIEDEAMIGMGATLLTGCKIGKGALIAAGAVVREGTVVPPHTLWAGVPAREISSLTAEQQGRLSHAYQHYVNCGVLYKAFENDPKS
ncbi:2,3,4,5-tetrahydropyridine-2,6-dicarboxylate N-acetyltransferase [Polystyrenella longa]|uniref:2,3,4,5-tetrahydropyridine-2,6-dicarboxylate N-acetyltransferase n=1 Tax=Polystyrenella longa TaxID=2528007 RepID=A0A518CIU5_9PLAN|nr:gamma carbonic anhydrase family protein [Polystyrenella longa]QDU79104.1 2,3,4,5-tetrahydropyridine-2,6-dicarboxylate N-acetyltransferase [Polystyrenella longa]